jgi:hypothetical protein
MEEETRQAIRQVRRERMQPVLDFLTLAKRCIAQEPIARVTNRLWEARRKGKMTLEEAREELREMYPEGFPGDEPDMLLLTRSASIAISTFSTSEVTLGLLRVFWSLTEDKRDLAEMSSAMTTAERAVERYLAQADPQTSYEASIR